jgi:hypothetical protein
VRERSHVLPALTLVLVAGVAFAQPSPQATKLFDEGRELAKQQKWADACDRFAQSLALDPAPGTKLNQYSDPSNTVVFHEKAEGLADDDVVNVAFLDAHADGMRVGHFKRLIASGELRLASQPDK